MIPKPCPKCDGTNISFTNCGYSSFDVAQAKCNKCGHAIGIDGSDARGAWNAFSHSKESREFYHWLLANKGHRHTPEQIVKAAEIIHTKKQNMLDNTNYSI